MIDPTKPRAPEMLLRVRVRIPRRPRRAPRGIVGVPRLPVVLKEKELAVPIRPMLLMLAVPMPMHPMPVAMQRVGGGTFKHRFRALPVLEFALLVFGLIGGYVCVFELAALVCRQVRT